MPVSHALLTSVLVASAVSAAVTAAFALAVRLLWRRRKDLREP